MLVVMKNTISKILPIFLLVYVSAINAGLYRGVDSEG